MRFPQLLTLGLTVSLCTPLPLAFSATTTKMPLKKATPTAVKAQVKKSGKAPLNPLVPYTLSTDSKPVMIPQSLMTLLLSPVPLSLPQDTDFLRTVSLDVSRYPDGLPLSKPFSTADEVIAALTSSSNLAVHMETLRRGYTELPSVQKKDLVVRLLKRYEKAPEDAVSYFDYGYAQLVYLNNQTGLFFLRKANDKLKNQFTALAYAMGQAQVDLNQEKNPPDEMSMRKLDVIHKLSDALIQDIQEHRPGFWPAYVQVIQKLGQFPAYQAFTKKDFSVSYIPEGKKLSYNQMMAVQSSRMDNYALVALTPDQSGKQSIKNKARPYRVEQSLPVVDNKSLIGIRTIPNTTSRLQFSRLETPDHVKVTVLDAQNQSLLSFISYGGMDIVEDLDSDGMYELVVRQYRQAPFDPVRVYRLKDNEFELDQELYNKFQ